ncbi:MAG: type II toxin-antitoxin system VapC family toxin [Planctomycetota bacterium]|jgi:predicted nucleic acid-binding protein
MIAVIDASVVVKWFFPESKTEPQSEQALALLAEIRAGSVEPLQPAHWFAEVAAVVTRLRPEIALEAIELLDAMELPVIDDVAIYKRASMLANDLGQHLFDTLYHALALESGATLVSADQRYYGKAKRLGHIVRLADWPHAV